MLEVFLIALTDMPDYVIPITYRGSPKYECKAAAIPSKLNIERTTTVSYILLPLNGAEQSTIKQWLSETIEVIDTSITFIYRDDEHAAVPVNS